MSIKALGAPMELLSKSLPGKLLSVLSVSIGSHLRANSFYSVVAVAKLFSGKG
jgi:hypothetical protein